ncbi:MAG TPA: RnfABCDGE type electron transport complex subunit D, partial [Longimicrobiaceae bacterium]|nr:RnfABCDGE type electron transport complex subunit D [Longimicrobiaceae bacterium]
MRSVKLPPGAMFPAPPRLELTAAPHLRAPDSTARIMWTVVATLVPLVAASVLFFGLGALLVVLAATAGALATERAFGPGGPTRAGSLRDGSAVITGILLGLTLPPGFPLWMALLGGAFAIGIGKLVFGGLGQNVFNPALVGRAVLQAAFPTAITTWARPGQGWTTVYPSNLVLPLQSPQGLDLVTAATPLGLMKFEHQGTAVLPLFLGTTGGSLGETSALLVLLGGAFLAWKGYLDWRIPAGVLLTVAAFAGVLHALDPRYPGPLFMLFSGGLMLGAVYMATDMVTSPVTHRGAWIFAVGIGLLVVLIRVWGGLPEGVMYAVLLMNALVPAINRLTRPRVFGAPAPAQRTAPWRRLPRPTSPRPGWCSPSPPRAASPACSWRCCSRGPTRASRPTRRSAPGW